MSLRACRIRVLDQRGARRGCGFIVDERHAMTCRHVVDFAMHPAQAKIGDRFLIEHDNQRGEPPLEMQVVKLGEGKLDACVLGRVDGDAFLPTQTALWQDGKAGTRYVGLGMSKDFEGIPLSGELEVDDLGMADQFVTADDTDNRIVKGSSGAGLFAEGEGFLLGMVTEFQQDRSGKIVRASVLAQFWPEMKKFAPAASEPFPSLTPSAGHSLPVAELIRNVDRTPQKSRLFRAISNRSLLADPGYLIAEIAGVELDLPDECSQSLRSIAFLRILNRIAQDSRKDCPTYFLRFDEVYDGDADEDLLLTSLGLKLGAFAASAAEVREAFRRGQTPIAVVVRLRAAQLARLPAGTAQTWADTLASLADPANDQPLALIICVLRDGEEAGGILAGHAERPWAMPLPPLTEIELNHVDDWCDNALQDRADDAKSMIRSLVAANGGGDRFRLGELKGWLGGRG